MLISTISSLKQRSMMQNRHTRSSSATDLAYTSTGELTIERVSKIKEYCKDCPKDIEIIFVTAFQTMKKCQQKFLSIAWDTEIWVAEEPTHMIHKNGNKFLDAHSNTISKNK